MRRRQRRRLLLKSFRTLGADKVFIVYFIWFFVAAIPIWLIEPHIKTYADSLWFCFASATSTGYGDITATTIVGRIITIILSVYSIAVIAIFTAVITSFFMDLARAKAIDSAHKFTDDLEHLSELSKEELENLSERVKKFLKK